MWSQPESIRWEAVRKTRYQDDANGLTFEPIFLQIQLSLPPPKKSFIRQPRWKYWIKPCLFYVKILATVNGLSIAFPIKTVRSSEIWITVKYTWNRLAICNNAKWDSFKFNQQPNGSIYWHLKKKIFLFFLNKRIVWKFHISLVKAVKV
jgi:hypothetical protein